MEAVPSIKYSIKTTPAKWRYSENKLNQPKKKNQNFFMCKESFKPIHVGHVLLQQTEKLYVQQH